jgi:hypothetical protein
MATLVVGLAIFGALRLAADSLGWLLARLEAASARAVRPGALAGRDGRAGLRYWSDN